MFRSPISPAHGGLSGWHPAELAAHVMAAGLDRHGIKIGDIDLVVFGVSNPVGALTNLAQSVRLIADWPTTLETFTVSDGQATGHRALSLAVELATLREHRNVAVCSIDMASLVPPGAPLLRRDYGKPWTPPTMRGFVDRGGHLPDGPFGDQLGVDRATLDRHMLDQHQRASAFNPDLVPIEKRTADPERSNPVVGPLMKSDELVRHNLAHEQLADLPPMYDSNGVITSASQGQPCDGVVGAVLTGDQLASGWSVGQTACSAGDPVAPLEALVAAWDRALIAGNELSHHVLPEPTAAHAVALTNKLGLQPSTVNPAGGPTARGWLYGSSGLAGLHDTLQALDAGTSPDTIVTCCSISGDGRAFVTPVTRHNRAETNPVA